MRSTAKQKGLLILGTSGFSYEHWRDVFYPPGTPQSRWLEVYAEHFSAVELNVTFYRLPRRETFEGWARRTPSDFRFVVKGSRTITHYRRLHDASAPLDALLTASDGLGEKLACILWQLPPQLPADPARLDEFCETLAERTAARGGGGDLRHAFEFRDAGWFSDPVLAVLRRYGHALVFADPPREREPRELTADWAYLRFHHGRRSDGGYEDAEIEPYARLAAHASDEGKDVFAFFNNDMGGWAPKNAERFRALVADQHALAR